MNDEACTLVSLARRALTHEEMRLLNDFQRNFPLEARPFKRLAEMLGISEDDVLGSLRRLQAEGVITRVGPVFAPNRVGASTLAAMTVPEDCLAEVAAAVSRFPEVNHNYEREHHYNLWFVATAPDAECLQAVIGEIERAAGYPVLELPMLRDYFIDLGFPLEWESPRG